MKTFTRILRPAPKPQTPIEALQLAEDMERIKMAMGCLRDVDGQNICESREDGEQQIRSWLITLEKCYKHAQQRLRRDFLAVEQPRK